MRWLANEQETKLAVDAARYGGQQEAWLDTELTIRTGVGMQIAASGTVDLRPADAGTAVVSPDGLQSSRTPRGGGPGGFAPGGGGRGFARAAGGVQSPGMLLGRIGEYGKIFVIGSRFEGAATEEGKLYLRIVPSPYNSESSGTYEVRVTSGR